MDKVVTTTAEQEVVYQELVTLCTRHINSGITKLEILAIAANLVGKLLAMQDQRTVTPELAMKIVTKNIEIGNQQIIDQVLNTKGSA